MIIGIIACDYVEGINKIMNVDSNKNYFPPINFLFVVNKLIRNLSTRLHTVAANVTVTVAVSSKSSSS